MMEREGTFSDDICGEIVQYLEPSFVISTCQLISKQFMNACQLSAKLSFSFSENFNNDLFFKSQYLENITELTFVNIQDENFLSRINLMANLKSLHIETDDEEIGIGNDGVKLISEMKNGQLTDLYLPGHNITEEGLVFISRMNQLKVLDIGFNKVGGKGLENLVGLTQLTNLHVSQVSLTDCYYIGQNFKQLKALHIGFNFINCEGVKALRSLKQLTDLTAFLNRIGDEGAKYISEIDTLTRLDMRSNYISQEGAKYISGMKNLKELYISKNRKMGKEGALSICNMKQMQILGIDGFNIGSDGAIKLIGEMKDLESLDISHSQINDEGVKHLCNLKKLTRLYVCENEIGEEGAKLISTMNQLISLRIVGNPIKMDGFKALKEMKQLTDLDFNEMHLQ